VSAMLDAIFIVAGVGFLLLCWGYASICEQL
jgi:hypothetical protein